MDRDRPLESDVTEDLEPLSPEAIAERDSAVRQQETPPDFSDILDINNSALRSAVAQ